LVTFNAVEHRLLKRQQLPFMQYTPTLSAAQHAPNYSTPFRVLHASVE